MSGKALFTIYSQNLDMVTFVDREEIKRER
jgi:hypothetical protein